MTYTALYSVRVQLLGPQKFPAVLVYCIQPIKRNIAKCIHPDLGLGPITLKVLNLAFYILLQEYFPLSEAVSRSSLITMTRDVFNYNNAARKRTHDMTLAHT